MKIKYIIIAVVMFVSTAIFLLTNTQQKDSNENVLIVGTNAEYPPYTFIENGEIVGFDIDIAKEISKRLGKSLKIHDVPFEALIAELSLGKVDFLAAGMSRTEERAKRVFFTKPYYSDDLLVIVSQKENAIKDVEGLSGKNVVVNEGYTADLFASQIEDIDLVRLSAPADAFLALNSGRANAFITANSTIDNFVKENSNKNYCITPIEDSSEGVSLVVSKKNLDLQVKIENILAELKKDGTMQYFKEKWGLK